MERMNKIVIANKMDFKIPYKEGVYRIIIDGKEVKTGKEFWQRIEEEFKFPEKCTNINMLLDYFTDLSWISEEKIELVVINKRHFLRKEKRYKKEIIKILKEDVLPFWDSEVENVVVGGKRKDFTVFFVDELYGEEETQGNKYTNWIKSIYDKYIKSKK